FAAGAMRRPGADHQPATAKVASTSALPAAGTITPAERPRTVPCGDLRYHRSGQAQPLGQVEAAKKAAKTGPRTSPGCARALAGNRLGPSLKSAACASLPPPAR